VAEAKAAAPLAPLPHSKGIGNPSSFVFSDIPGSFLLFETRAVEELTVEELRITPQATGRSVLFHSTLDSWTSRLLDFLTPSFVFIDIPGSFRDFLSLPEVLPPRLDDILSIGGRACFEARHDSSRQ
jgi:hypothetical protein